MWGRAPVLPASMQPDMLTTEDLFEARMLYKKINKKLLEYPGPLSTPAARTDIAYNLGWIGPETYRHLVTMRRVRNKFAHAHAPITFSDTEVLGLCRELQGPNALPWRFKARDRFFVTASILALRLEFCTRESHAPAAGVDPQVKRLPLAELEGGRGVDLAERE